MAQDFTAKKQAALNALLNFSQNSLPVALQLAEFVSEMTDSGFLTGGANPITDADCQSRPVTAHLTAALVNTAVTALGTITLSTANKTILRQASGSTIQSLT